MSKQNETLAIRDVSVAYGGIPVIQDVNLSVKPGEFFGLVGLNGAGKTTLIKAILGLRAHETGQIEVFGQSSDHKESKANLAYLPERFEPPWFLTGIEFIKFSLRLYCQDFDQDQVVLASEKLALDPAVLKRRVQTYSKGMRQKLGLLGTILTNRNLLILDEPMSGLDPMARSLVKDMLTEKKSKDQTVFVCSHILADMEEMCERVAVLNGGTIQFVGKPKDLIKETKSKTLERAFLHFVEEKQAA